MSKELSDLSVIITTHNRLDYTRRTLESLIKTCPKDTQFVIYDDKSDETGMIDYLTDFIQGDWNNRMLILGNSNVGWGAGVNMCLKHAYNDMVLISNNDVIYKPHWYETMMKVYDEHTKIGILGVWKHTAHGVLNDKGSFIQKDQMPAVGWLMKRSTIDSIGSFPEKGPCHTKGGNGEDTRYCDMAIEKGYMVGGLKDDVADHIDGY